MHQMPDTLTCMLEDEAVDCMETLMYVLDDWYDRRCEAVLKSPGRFDG